jgi:hypothetical protein
VDYAWHYGRLIERARGRVLDDYVERHHVLPRCMGGGNERENLVQLTPEEHYVAHQLLVKMHPGHRGLLWSAMAMTNGTRVQARNNRVYGWLRRRFAQYMSESNKLRPPTSDESRAKMSAAHLGKSNGPHSAETRAKMSAAPRGRKKSPEHCAAMSEAKRGKKRKPHSEATKAKMRVSQRIACLTRDESFRQTPEYREKQRQNMRRIWAERQAQKEG